MKEIITNINRKLNYTNTVIIKVYDYLQSVNSFESCTDKKSKQLDKKVKILVDYHNNYNGMYALLQSFHYSVSNFDTIYYEEIEAKWLDILKNWFILENEVPEFDEEYIGAEMDVICYDNFKSNVRIIRKILISDTQALNKFSLKYLNNKEKNLISFSDYKFLFEIKNEYCEKKEHIDEIKEFGKEALNDRDRKLIRTNNFDIDSYTYFLKNKSEDLSRFKSFRSHKEDFMQENKESIIAKPFKFNFIKSADYVNPKSSLKDYYITQTYSYLINNGQLLSASINKGDYEYIVINKKLPIKVNKIAWKGSLTDAFILCKLLEIELSRFNRCFNLSNGKLLKSNSAGKNPQTDFAKFTRKLAVEFDSVV